jgi:hypothetical protein
METMGTRSVVLGEVLDNDEQNLMRSGAVTWMQEAMVSVALGEEGNGGWRREGGS